jgi:hypothetical protein
VVAHACYSSYAGESSKIMVQGQPRQKLARVCLKNKLGVVVQSYKLSCLGGGSRRIEVQGLGKSARPYLKNKIKQTNKQSKKDLMSGSSGRTFA